MSTQLEKYITPDPEMTYTLASSGSEKTLDDEAENDACNLLLVSGLGGSVFQFIMFFTGLIPIPLFLLLLVLTISGAAFSSFTSAAYYSLPYQHRDSLSRPQKMGTYLKLLTFQRVTFAEEHSARAELKSVGLRTTQVQEYTKATLSDEWLAGLSSHIQQSVEDYKDGRTT